jgi:serine/threonine protein kinase
MGSLLVTGQRVGPYEIIARIGQGGMATVYKAYHPQLDRFVAIKMMQPTFVIESNFRTRFEREARIVGGLEHPHILPVYDFAEYEGQPYLVMKLIEGSSLKTVLSQGPLEPDDLMMVLPPIASALDYAHHQGVLHRDIKPSNILIDQRATPYLTDFGLARASHQINDNNMISQDMFIGTPYYVSPEQGMGERDLTAQSDLYSLGVVLYELLTGRVPFDSGSYLSPAANAEFDQPGAHTGD